MSHPSRSLQRGASRSSRVLARDAMDAIGAVDERLLMRTAKSRGPDAPTLASSWRKMIRQRRRLSSPDSGESAYKPLHHCAGKAGSLRLDLWFLTRVLSTLAHEAAGATSIRSSLRPLISEGHCFAELGHIMPREHFLIFPPLSCPGLTGGIQYAAAPRFKPRRLWNTGSPGQAGRRHRICWLKFESEGRARPNALTIPSPMSPPQDRRQSYDASPPPRAGIQPADRCRARRPGCSGSTASSS